MLYAAGVSLPSPGQAALERTTLGLAESFPPTPKGLHCSAGAVQPLQGWRHFPFPTQGNPASRITLGYGVKRLRRIFDAKHLKRIART
jgi:hypothetical protein